MIRHATSLKMLTAFCLVLGLTATAQAAGNPNGSWKWKVAFQGNEFELTATLKAEGEKLTGSISTPQGSTDITDGSFKNDEVSFSLVRERNGNKSTTKYKGKVDGDTIKGKTERERNGEVMSTDWEAKREK